jgi:hypothetical protein
MRALVVALVLALPALARAQEDACLTTPVDGQKLQRAGRLLEARERFRACSSKNCPPEVVEDCTRWARDVEEALPSIVLVARDRDGRDLPGVTASIDGAPLTPINARAIPVDPGTHRVVFHKEGAADATQDLIVHEGEKNRNVNAVFAQPVVPRPPGVPAPPERPVPTGAFVAGGIGALALAGFATFGALGVSGRASRGCDIGCSSSDKKAVDTELRVADVSLAVAVVALGVATWLYLTRPASPPPRAALVW